MNCAPKGRNGRNGRNGYTPRWGGVQGPQRIVLWGGTHAPQPPRRCVLRRRRRRRRTRDLRRVLRLRRRRVLRRPPRGAWRAANAERFNFNLRASARSFSARAASRITGSSDFFNCTISLRTSPQLAGSFVVII